MAEEKITRLQFDDDFLLDGAERRIGDGDYFGALTVLNKREERNRPLADAYALYAEIYEALELWQLAADAWFRFLDTCNEADFAEGYEGLGVAFMNMGNTLQSGFYYHCASHEDESYPDPFDFDESIFEDPEPPKLRLVHAEGMPHSDAETLTDGLELLRTGNLEEAKARFSEIDEDSEDFASGAGLSAMCSLMLGDEDGAANECRALIEKYPENVQVLTTYCAVLGALEREEEAKKVASRLADLKVTSTDDLYRVATALCETGLDEDAYGTLCELKKRLPYDSNVLWFHAVSAYRTGHAEEAISSLETLTTLYPRKEIAKWYLARFRSEEAVKINYYYRMPEEKYRSVAAFLLKASGLDEEEKPFFTAEEFAENFRLAFDEMEGRDEKLQMLAAKVACKLKADFLLREMLLDCEGNEIVKLAILHELTCRNAEDSFGTVICNLYKEFFTHELDLGRRKKEEFLQAFADVYAKYALLGEEYANKICMAGEELYYALSEAGAWELLGERAALASAIYREARLKGGERGLKEICKLFDAEPAIAEIILGFVM